MIGLTPLLKPDHPSHKVCPANVMAAFISEDYFYPINCDQRLWLGRQAYLKDNADHFEN